MKTTIQTALNGVGLACFVAGALFLFVLGTSVGLPMHTPGVAALGIGAFLLVLSSVYGNRAELHYQPSKITETVFLMGFAYLVWRCWVSPVQYLAELDLFLLAIAASTILTCRFVSNWKLFVRILTVVLGCFALVQVPICYHQAFVDQSYSPWEILNLSRPAFNQTRSAVGFFFHQNAAGAFNALIAAYLGGWLLYGRVSLLWRIALLLCWSAAVANTLMTFSRSAFLALVVGHAILLAMLLFFGLGAKVKLWKRIAVGLGAMGLGGVIFALTSSWAARLATQRFGDDANVEQLAVLNGRRESWDIAMSMFMDSPIVGHGSRMFEVKEYAYRPADISSLSADNVYAHNDYLQALSDYGMIGGIVVLLVVLLAAGLVISLAIRALPGREDAEGTYQGRALAAGCAGLIGATAVDNFFSFSWHFPPIVFLTALAMGLLLRSLGNNADDSDKESFIGLSGRIALAVVWLAVGGVVVCYSGIVGSRYGSAYWSLNALAVESKKSELPNEVILERYQEIISVLPRFPYYLEGGALARKLALSPEIDASHAMELMSQSYEYLDAAVRLNPMSCPARSELAETCLLLGRYEEAEKHQQIASDLGLEREYFFNNTFALARIQYVRAIIAINNVDHYEASSALRRALATLERGSYRMNRENYERGQLLKKDIDEEIAFLKRTQEWKEEDGE